MDIGQISSGVTSTLNGVSSTINSFSSTLNNFSAGSSGAPGSQKADAKPIGFALSGGSAPTQAVQLVIRPEDLTIGQPSRISVQQTLGGAWADSFGLGLESLLINGHTGWRGGPGGDGMAQFAKLDGLFKGWHSQRADAIEAGNDPNDVALYYMDTLNSFTAKIAPISFTLKRNRARPLLMQYQINAVVLLDESNYAMPGSNISAGLDSLNNTLSNILSMVKSVDSLIDTVIGGPVKALMNLTASALGAINAVKGAITAAVAPVLSIARNLTQAARNVFQCFAAVNSATQFIKSQLMGIASEFNNAFCLLSNVFRAPQAYPNYDDWYGASNCSSTAPGGRPLSPLRFQNPFALLYPGNSQTVTVNAPAQASIATLALTDPALKPLTTAQLAPHLNNIAAGVSLS